MPPFEESFSRAVTRFAQRLRSRPYYPKESLSFQELALLQREALLDYINAPTCSLILTAWRAWLRFVAKGQHLIRNRHGPLCWV